MKIHHLILSLAATTALLAQDAVQTTLNNYRSQNGAKPAKIEKTEPATLKSIAGELTTGAAVSHVNLSIYLLSGRDLADTTQVLTLDEALSAKSGVVVKETQQVNELAVENNQTDKQVFIMAGDIVKGGQQDRALASDLPLMPKSGSVPVTSFCVEQGRWKQRGQESVTQFSSSKNSITSKEGKLAVRKAGNQGEVWQSVEKSQAELSKNIGKDVKPAASASSLQLTLEDKDLKSKLKAFQEALLPIVEQNPQSLGFVYVINGEINSAEIFAGHDLFRRLWPKMLDSIATEAISLADAKIAVKPATQEDVTHFVKQAETAPAVQKSLHGTLKHVSAESDESCLFETIETANGGQWLRRNIIKK